MTKMLIDEIQPVWHYGHRHSRVIDAPADRVAEALETLDMERETSPLVRFLFRARGLRPPEGATPREAAEATGFSLLAERPGREMVFGIAGKFWALHELANLKRVPDAEAYKRFDVAGQAKGAMTFVIEPLADGRTLLRTETRVTCSDLRARLLFGAYWALIKIPSEFIRRDMLHAVARRVEQLSRTPELRAIG